MENATYNARLKENKNKSDMYGVEASNQQEGITSPLGKPVLLRQVGYYKAREERSNRRTNAFSISGDRQGDQIKTSGTSLHRTKSTGHNSLLSMPSLSKSVSRLA